MSGSVGTAFSIVQPLSGGSTSAARLSWLRPGDGRVGGLSRQPVPVQEIDRSPRR
jgi:hypothetical protein